MNGNGELTQALEEQAQAWDARPLLRRLYGAWFERAAAELSQVEGPTIELGSGIGTFKEAYPFIVATDVEPTRWSDAVVDATRLPYEDGSVANLVLVDVFHHLGRPVAFLDEARRVLRAGGRVIIVDPYCSPLSTLAYTRLHHERTDLSAPAFDDDRTVEADPMSSNQARATLVFFRGKAEFDRRWPEFRVARRERFAFLAYPLSGGFSRRPLLPNALYPAIAVIERLLQPLEPALAFRCLVVLERS
jgi:SAM-dependent methyltransferase